MSRLGHQIERVSLSKKRIDGCLGCLKCEDSASEPGCVRKDDGGEIIEKITGADAVIFASPLYFWGFSAQMKALIDRCYCLHRGVCGALNHTSFVEGQHQALIVTAADPFENNAEHLVTVFQRMLVYNKAKSAGELLIHNCTSPDQLGKGIREDAARFAKQFFKSAVGPYSILVPGGAPNWVPKVE